MPCYDQCLFISLVVSFGLEIPDMKTVKSRSWSADRPRTQRDGKVVVVKTEFPVASLVLSSIAGSPAC